MHKIKVSWDEVHNHVNRLSAQIAKQDADGIYAIPNGGLILGVMISKETGLPLILDFSKTTQRTAIVDDIADSGDTFLTIPDVHKYKTFAMYYRLEGKFMPTHYNTDVEEGVWLWFPWEPEYEPTQKNNTFNFKESFVAANKKS
jgi:hypoxanthine phosphoribosyltransferase